MTATTIAPQHIRPSGSMPWHDHAESYAAVVLEGGYLEAGDDGRRRVSAGDVIIHAPFCGHANWFDQRGAVIVNLPLTLPSAFALASGRAADPAGLVRDVAASPEAVELLLRDAIVKNPGEDDLPDQLAVDLRDDAQVSLAIWAERKGVAPRTLRRQFGQIYGTSPLAFRARARARRAWQLIMTSDLPLAGIAYDLGFADQAHMSRAVAGLSGRPPRHWRAVRGRSIQD
jgi:AraC-like DNA-binding protein